MWLRKMDDEELFKRDCLHKDIRLAMPLGYRQDYLGTCQICHMDIIVITGRKMHFTLKMKREFVKNLLPK